MLIFLIIDQVIKALLYFAPSEISIPVIPNILSILVILNKYQTLVLQAADKFASPYIVACAKLLLLPFFLLLLYLLSKSKNRFNFKTPIGYAGVTLISSAILSTVLDSLIYKGTPDYFYLIPLYSSVDLKDVFAFLGAGCILSIISTNEKNMQKKTTNMEAKWFISKTGSCVKLKLWSKQFWLLHLGYQPTNRLQLKLKILVMENAWKMIDDGDICAAEDLLFNDLDQSDLSWLQIALDFYSKLNNCSDDYLAMHDFLVKKLIKDFDTSARCLVMIFGKQLVHVS